MNVKIIFLYNQIEKKIYVKQSHNFAFEQYLFKIYKLNKTFYDLKQSFWIWYNIFINYIKDINLVFIDVDFNVFIDLIIDIIVALYVNDILIIDPFKTNIQRIKNALYAKFKMSDLDFCAYYLDIIVIRDRVNRTLRLKQSIYIERFFKQYNMWKFKS